MALDTQPIAFQKKYSDDFLYQYRQEGSMLMDTVTVDMNVNGSHFLKDRVGESVAQLKVGGYVDTPLMDLPFSRRSAVLKPYHNAHGFSIENIQRMTADPIPSAVRSLADSFGVKTDEIIIAAADGNSTSVDENGTEANVALPSAQVVAAGAAGLTFAKVLDAQEILMANNVRKENMTLVISPKQWNDLIAEEKFTSGDYQTYKALTTGQINTVMGMRVVVSNYLGVDGSSDRKCLLYVRDSIVLGVGINITVRVTPDNPAKSYGTQVYAHMMKEAVRVQEEGVVVITCVES